MGNFEIVIDKKGSSSLLDAFNSLGILEELNYQIMGRVLVVA